MSNGMYCSASHWIASASSASVITGTEIFLTMTALPESEAATSFVAGADLSSLEVLTGWLSFEPSR